MSAATLQLVSLEFVVQLASNGSVRHAKNGSINLAGLLELVVCFRKVRIFDNIFARLGCRVGNISFRQLNK